MRVTVFSAKPYDRVSFDGANDGRHELTYLEVHLDERTAPLAAGADAVCAFVNDVLDAPTLAALAEAGVRAVALRSAGFNNVDLEAAARLGLPVVRVPAYSPAAVAEHTIGLILALDRHLPRAYNRVREGNFALDGLLGFDLCGRTAGVVGTGRIGARVATVLLAFGCRVLASDPVEVPELVAAGVTYVDLPELLRSADVVTLHCPLTPATHHLIDADAVAAMRPGVMLVNTGRGALVDAVAVIEGLKSGRIGHLGLDVYEEEGPLFFEDLSSSVIADDVFMRLTTFPNVLITGHQAFFTSEALAAIAGTTLGNLDDLAVGRPCPNEVRPG